MNETVLDNPAWEALTSQHSEFAQGDEQAKRYRPGILPFAGCFGGARGSLEGLNAQLAAGESFYIIGDDLPRLHAGWIVANELPCAQMLLRTTGTGLPPPANPPVAVKLMGEADGSDMYELINSVQPGYYNIATRLLGTYYGIRDAGKLVAMAGERMRLDGYSELSAICTDAAYTGRGYAQQLIEQICRMHSVNNIISFLHVARSNERAIRLYRHLGFEQRRTIVFRKITKC